MQTGKACDETVTGEARVRIEGGLAHFPGFAKQQTVSFDDLATPEHQCRQSPDRNHPRPDRRNIVQSG